MNVTTIARALRDDAQDGVIQPPCDEALVWLGRRRSWHRAWLECPRGDWLLWAARQYGYTPTLVWLTREIVAPLVGRAADATEDQDSGELSVRLHWHQSMLLSGAMDDATAEARLKQVEVILPWEFQRVVAAAVHSRSVPSYGEAVIGLRVRAMGGDARSLDDPEHRRCADIVRRLWPEPPWRDTDDEDGEDDTTHMDRGR